MDSRFANSPHGPTHGLIHAVMGHAHGDVFDARHMLLVPHHLPRSQTLRQWLHPGGQGAVVDASTDLGGERSGGEEDEQDERDERDGERGAVHGGEECRPLVVTRSQ